MDSKLVSLKEAASMVSSQELLAIGGNVLHRAPMAFLRELVREGKKELRLVKTAGAMDVDLLCASGCVQSVDAGFISYETRYGLATHYRRAVESGQIKANEHACYTVISALRAAVCGAPFMPVRGLVVSDLLKYNDYFEVLEDPFGSGPIAVVKAIRPDTAVIHVQRCDRYGNAFIEGPVFEDVLMAKAAKRVIVTTETVLPDRYGMPDPSDATIPHFLVDAVVHVKNGAWPCSCYGRYDIDDKGITEFKGKKSSEEVVEYILQCDRSAGVSGVRR